MFTVEFDFIVETLDELMYRRGVIHSMLADWKEDKEYDSYIENLETAFCYLDFSVATLQGVVDVAKRKKDET